MKGNILLVRKAKELQHSKILIFILMLWLCPIGLVSAQDSALERLRAATTNEPSKTAVVAKPLPSAPVPAAVPAAAVAIQAQDENQAFGDAIAAQPAAVIQTQTVETARPLTLRDQAFKQLLDKLSPLTPEQIIEMRKQQDKTQRAVATLPGAPPRPVSSTLTVDLSPGSTPPVVRLGAGFVTSIVFVDSTGQAWPIADYSIGNPKNFNIQWDKKTNTLFIQSATTYANGNLAVRLATLNTPIMLSLVSGQKEIDYRVDLQVPGRGPNALEAIVGETLPCQPEPILLSVLDGVPPPGSIEVEVSGGCGRAWLWKGKLIFRTQLTILSPAWSATVSSIDGTKVYELSPTPLILASQNGKMVKVMLKGI